MKCILDCNKPTNLVTVHFGYTANYSVADIPLCEKHFHLASNTHVVIQKIMSDKLINAYIRECLTQQLRGYA